MFNNKKKDQERELERRTQDQNINRSFHEYMELREVGLEDSKVGKMAFERLIKDLDKRYRYSEFKEIMGNKKRA